MHVTDFVFACNKLLGKDGTLTYPQPESDVD